MPTTIPVSPLTRNRGPHPAKHAMTTYKELSASAAKLRDELSRAEDAVLIVNAKWRKIAVAADRERLREAAMVERSPRTRGGVLA